jgi:hypothetical protein
LAIPFFLRFAEELHPERDVSSGIQSPVLQNEDLETG